MVSLHLAQRRGTVDEAARRGGGLLPQPPPARRFRGLCFRVRRIHCFRLGGQLAPSTDNKTVKGPLHDRGPQEKLRLGSSRSARPLSRRLQRQGEKRLLSFWRKHSKTTVDTCAKPPQRLLRSSVILLPAWRFLRSIQSRPVEMIDSPPKKSVETNCRPASPLVRGGSSAAPRALQRPCRWR